MLERRGPTRQNDIKDPSARTKDRKGNGFMSDSGVEAEKALRERDGWLEVLFEHAADPIYFCKSDGSMVRVNRRACVETGYSREELLALNVTDLDVDHGPEALEAFRKTVPTGHPVALESRHRRKDGSIFPVELSIARLETSDGERFMAIARDATDHKRAERALRESEEKYRTIFLNSPLGVFRSTFEGRFLEVNPALAEMLGYDSPEEVVREVRDIAEQIYVRTEDREDIVARQLPSKDVSRHLNRYRRRDGSEFVADLYLKTVRDAEGRSVCLEGIVEDVTERKRAEDGMRTALEEKEALLREVRHRVVNNLQEIMSLLRLYASKIEDERSRKVFDACRHRVHTMALVQEALRRSANPNRIDVRALLERLVPALRRAHWASERIEVEASPCSVHLKMDRGIALGMALAELIDNAFEHAFPPGAPGKVSVRLSPLEGKGEAELIVRDDGVGLPEETKVRGPGFTGLRLVAGMVEGQLGGSLETRSDGGTRFAIRFKGDE